LEGLGKMSAWRGENGDRATGGWLGADPGGPRPLPRPQDAASVLATDSLRAGWSVRPIGKGGRRTGHDRRGDRYRRFGADPLAGVIPAQGATAASPPRRRQSRRRTVAAAGVRYGERP